MTPNQQLEQLAADYCRGRVDFTIIQQAVASHLDLPKDDPRVRKYLVTLTRPFLGTW